MVYIQWSYMVIDLCVIFTQIPILCVFKNEILEGLGDRSRPQRTKGRT